MPFPYPCPYDPSSSSTSPSSTTDVSPSRRKVPGSASENDKRFSLLDENVTGQDEYSTSLNATIVEGPTEGCLEEPHRILKWLLQNSGTCAWPESTTLRLVGGPEVADPVIHIPSLIPGQTYVVELSLRECSEEAAISYALTTFDGRLFGRLLKARVQPKRNASVPPPVCMVVSSPMNGILDALEASPGELKNLEWWLVNAGQAAWPEDMHLTLSSSSAGLILSKDACEMHVPSVPPSVTMQICISVVMPIKPGRFRAQWLLRTPSYADFSHTLSVDIEVPSVANNANSRNDHCADQLHTPPESSEVATKRTGVSAPVDAELFEKALKQIGESAWEVQRECYATMVKICSNIRSSPENLKFRRIPKSSKRIVSDVLTVPGGIDLMLAAGFLDQEDAFVLPELVAEVDTVLIEMQSRGTKVSMDIQRLERDARIKKEKEKDVKNQLIAKPRLTAEMKATLQRIKDDQDLLQDKYKGIDESPSIVDRLLDKSFCS